MRHSSYSKSSGKSSSSSLVGLLISYKLEVYFSFFIMLLNLFLTEFSVLELPTYLDIVDHFLPILRTSFKS